MDSFEIKCEFKTIIVFVIFICNRNILALYRSYGRLS